MTQHIFIYKKSPVSYYRFGNGKEVLVAFHGYDQTGENYFYFEDVLSEYFTVIAIDFFWHGKSEWKEVYDFTQDDMKEIVLGISHQEKLFAKKFSICSFSMGARMARALVRTFPEKIENLILISPPTFTFNTFLNFTTNSSFGLMMFRYLVKKNFVLLSWVKFLNRIKILNRSVYLFTAKFIVRKERMEKVFKTWYSQRKLQTDFDSFAKLLNDHAIHVVLIVAKKDAISPPNKMVGYVRKLKHRRIFIVRTKHELATPETKRIFKKMFSSEDFK